MFPQGLADNRNHMGSLLRTVCHWSPAPRQILQSRHGAFRATCQESFALVQHGLFATAQGFGCGSDGLSLVSQQDSQDTNHQAGAFASLLLCQTQLLLFLAAELDSVFVRFASDGTLSPPFLGWPQFTPKTFGKHV